MMGSLLLGLAGLLVPDDPALDAALRLALEAPAQYLQQHPETGERLLSSERPERNPALPWLALTDQLIARRVAVEIDWTTDSAELAFALEQLDAYRSVSAAATSTLIDLEFEDDLTVHYLRTLAEALAAEGRVLAVIDIDSDSYVVMILEQQRYAAVTGKAAELGEIIKDIREHDPNQ